MERRASPALSLDDFQKTSDTDDFSSSLLSSLDFNLNKYDSSSENSGKLQINKELPSPKQQIEKRPSTASLRKNSPAIPSPLSSLPEISSSRNDYDMTSAESILDSFPSLSRELGNKSPTKTPKSAMKASRNSLIAASDSTLMQEESKNIEDDFESMLNSTGTKKVTAAGTLVRSRPTSLPPSPLSAAPVDDFELLLSAPGTKKVSATPEKMHELDLPNAVEEKLPRRSSLLGRIILMGKSVQSGLGLQKSNMMSVSSSDFENTTEPTLRKRSSLSLSIRNSRKRSSVTNSIVSQDEYQFPEVPTNSLVSPRTSSLKSPTPQLPEITSGRRLSAESISAFLPTKDFPIPPRANTPKKLDILKPVAKMPQSQSAFANVSMDDLVPKLLPRSNSLSDTNYSKSDSAPKISLRKTSSYRFSLSKPPSIPAFDDILTATISDSFDVDSITSSIDEESIKVDQRDSQLLQSLQSPTESSYEIPTAAEIVKKGVRAQTPKHPGFIATHVEAKTQTAKSSVESIQTQAYIEIISAETQTIRVSNEQVELVDFSCQTEDELVPILYSCYSYGCRLGDHCYSYTCPNRPQPTICARCLDQDEETAARVELLESENVRLLQEISALTLMVQTARSQTQQMQILKEAAESRFEQLARVAHRKLVRAMVDNRI